MSKRPVLSLKPKSESIEKTKLEVSEQEKSKPKFDQIAFEKKARKERMKRNHAALNVVKSLNLPMPLAKGIGRFKLLTTLRAAWLRFILSFLAFFSKAI